MCVCVCVCAHMYACPVASVLPNPSWPQGPYPTRLLSPWDFPGKNTEVGCQALLQRTFLTQRSNLRLLCLLHCKWIFTAEPPRKPVCVCVCVHYTHFVLCTLQSSVYTTLNYPWWNHNSSSRSIKPVHTRKMSVQEEVVRVTFINISLSFQK